MPTPFKDKQSGIYYLRVRVPADLVSTIERSEVSKSLRTREPQVAKGRFAAEYASLQKRWAALRAKPEPLPLKRIVSLAGRVYGDLMTMLETEPGETAIWEQVQRLNSKADTDEAKLEQWYGGTVDELLLSEGIATDAHSRNRLLKEVQRAWEQATEQQHKRSQGDFSPDPDANRFPEWKTATPALETLQGTTIADLFGRWEKDHLANGRSTKTVSDFSQKLQSLVTYLGHEDVKRITPRQISEWCDDLRDTKGLAAKTINAKYLAAVKAVFRLAKSKFLIESDPSEGVTVKVPKPVRSRPQGFTEDEARQILACANKVFDKPSRVTHHTKLARRWVPWICAYTGARVGEITQLRTQDLSIVDGIPQITITPEAGSVKAGRYRIVPLHPHLQEIGLIDFIQSAKPGYLFHAGGTREVALRRSGVVSGKIGGWVRDTAGIKDDRIAPNHGWRHRFKTIGKNADIDLAYLDAIQGHAGRTSGEGYGEFTTSTLYREICKVPCVDMP